jgi:methyl-accepting chemotaxis protein
MIEDLFEIRDLLNQSYREVRETKEANSIQREIENLNKSIDNLNKIKMNKTVDEMDELYNQLNKTKHNIEKSLKEIKKINNKTELASDILKNAQQTVSIISQIF